MMLKRLRYTSTLSNANGKICQAFVISSNQYGSFRAPRQTLYRADSFFSHVDLTVSQDQLTTVILATTEQQADSRLLEHYLKTYNPLHIDLASSHQTTLPNRDDTISEADTHPIDHCYPLNCVQQRMYSHGHAYRRLKDDEQQQHRSSTNMSTIEQPSSDCPTTLTCLTVPVVMITDCSDGRRLHTEIIEMNEDE
jgi:hypothetical protein